MKITLGRIAALTTLPAFVGEQIKLVERAIGETTVDLGAKGDSLFSGTGKYVGAKGSMTLHPRDAKGSSYDFTYDLP